MIYKNLQESHLRQIKKTKGTHFTRQSLAQRPRDLLALAVCDGDDSQLLPGIWLTSNDSGDYFKSRKQSNPATQV